MLEAGPGESAEHAMSVSELTGHLKAVVEETFPALWVSGEISNIARPRSGHIYFTLKDDSAEIRGVMWGSIAERLKFDLEDGQALLCFGNLEVYPARGTYQLMVRKMQPDGIGALQLALEQLRAKLEAKGLFDPARKRNLPAFPRRVVIVTSATSAALADFLETCRHRCPATEIIVIDAVVQGGQAATSVIKGLQAAHKIRPVPDAIVIARGGGSMEDLWPFNDQSLVEAIAVSRIPTVTGIGHEIDVTLADMAADARALTPTDAATRLLPDMTALGRAIDQHQQRLTGLMWSLIRQRRTQLESLAARPVLKSPLAPIQLRARMLDELDMRGRRAIQQIVDRSGQRLARSSASLTALSPLKVLARGYSMTLASDATPITQCSQVSSGDTLTTRLSDGEIRSIVK